MLNAEFDFVCAALAPTVMYCVTGIQYVESHKCCADLNFY